MLPALDSAERPGHPDTQPRHRRRRRSFWVCTKLPERDIFGCWAASSVHGHRGPQEGFYHPLQGDITARLDLPQHLYALCGNRSCARGKNLGQEMLFISEVIVQCCETYTGLRRNCPNSDTCATVFGKQPLAGLDQAVAARFCGSGQSLARLL